MEGAGRDSERIATCKTGQGKTERVKSIADGKNFERLQTAVDELQEWKPAKNPQKADKQTSVELG